MPWLDKLFKRKRTNEKDPSRNGSSEEKTAESAGAADGVNPAAENRKRILRRCGQILVLAVTLGFVIWYFMTPAYYLIPEEGKTLLTSKRTYIVLLMGAFVFAVVLIPNRLSDSVNRKVGWAWFFVSPFIIYYTLYHMNAYRFHIVFTKLNKIAVLFTFVFLYLLLLLVLFVLGSIRWSVAVVSVAVMLLGIVNWFVVDFRGRAISAADLFSIGEAATVADGFEYVFEWHVYSELFLVFIACVLTFKIRKFRALKATSRLAVLGICLVIAGGYYHICCRTTFLEDHDIRSKGFKHQLRYKQFDMLFTTLCTCFYLAADKPDGYSLEKVEEIAAAYVEPDEEAAQDGDSSKNSARTLIAEGGAGKVTAAETDSRLSGTAGEMDVKSGFNTPNLIVIMNESFADYTDIGKGLTLSQDCMPFIHGLEENTIKGTAYVSVFGGNTPNSEYEFLTGNTMGFLPPSSVGFNLFVRGEMPSLVSELKTLGYDTLAIHPYRGTNYRRHIVYPQLGFDRYLTKSNFNDPMYIRKYISDESLLRKIIRKYDEHNEETDAPFFSYNVTMQNHGGYVSTNVEGVPQTIKVEDQKVNQERTTIYVNLISESDKMFQDAVEHFKDEEEPVVIVMFGDHQANLGDSTYNYLLGKKEDDLTPEELMEKYKVPFVCWANYDIEEEVIEKTSLNYLYCTLADRLGLPLTGYQKYLLDLSEEIPVITAGGYWTADGDFYELDDETSPYFDRINEYNILEYNYIFGKDNRDLDLFSLSS